MFNWFLFLIVLFGLAVMLRADFVVTVLYIFAGIVLLARPWIRRALHQVDFRREYVDRAFIGEAVDVELEIINTGRLPLPWLSLRDDLPLDLRVPSFFTAVVSLLPGERYTFTYRLDCRRRGYFRLGPLTVRGGDLFGLADYAFALNRPDRLVVYPQVVPLRELGWPSHSPFGTLSSHERIFEDPARPAGVREYMPGDSLRRMDWKTTASTGRLQVRRYQPAIALEVGLLLNLALHDYSPQGGTLAAEWAIVVAASLAAHLIEKRQSIGLATNGLDAIWLEEGIATREAPLQILPSGKSRAHLTRILESLARLHVAPASSPIPQPFRQVVERGTLGLPWGATLVVITPQETEDLIPSLLQLQRRGFQVVLVLTDQMAKFQATQGRAMRLGIPTYHIWREKDLDVWR